MIVRRPPAADRRAKIDAWCAARTMGEICAALLEVGIPAAPVRRVPEVAKDPHRWERAMLVKMSDAVGGEIYLPGAAIRLSKTPELISETVDTGSGGWPVCDV